MKISISYRFLHCFVDVGFCWCCHSCVHVLLFLALIFGIKNQWKIIKTWIENKVHSGIQFWSPLGSSIASPRDPWGSKIVPKRKRNSDLGQFFFATLTCIIYFFRFLLPLGASGAYLGRVLDPLGPLLGGFLTLWGAVLAGLKKNNRFLASLPLFVFNTVAHPSYGPL